MAEAVLEVSNPYFCHKCSQEISPVLPDYVCPRCRSGFIEELTQRRDSVNHDVFDELSANDDDESQSDSSPPLENLLTNLGNSQPRWRQNGEGGGGGGGSGSGSSERASRSGAPRVQFRYVPYDSNHIQGIFHLISNITQGGGGSIDFPFNSDFPLFQVLHGNPGDYAWGSGGIDAVITQLLNQMDGTGPPPMPQEEINQLPTVKITQDQVDKNLQCTVCMEDYHLDEPVKKLSCTHVYHKDCILPWLEMHGTCPICRKLLNQSQPQNNTPLSNSPLTRLVNRTTVSGGNNSNNNNSSSNSRSDTRNTQQQQQQQRSQNNSNRRGNNRNRPANDGYYDLPDDYD